MSQWQAQADKSYQLSGELTRDTVPALWGTLVAWQPTEKMTEVSLAETTRIDSAGMVLLIHLIEHAKKSNCHIMLSFVPHQLRTLFQLSNVENLVAEHIKN